MNTTYTSKAEAYEEYGREVKTILLAIPEQNLIPCIAYISSQNRILGTWLQENFYG